MAPQNDDYLLRKCSRLRVRTSLIRAGMSREKADRWCDLWEREATRAGVATDRDYFWDAGMGWIDAQRGVTLPLR
jgi:hypothetical protein